MMRRGKIFSQRNLRFLFTFLISAGLFPRLAYSSHFTFYPLADTYVSLSEADSNFGINERLGAGDWQDGSENKFMRSYLKFNISPIMGSTIASAKLKLWHYYTKESGNADNFNLYRLTGSWQEEGLTWNNQPPYETAVSSSLLIVSGSYGLRVWNVTDAVREWASGTYENYGVMIENDLDNSFNEFKRLYFRSREYSGQDKPLLEVEAIPVPEASSLLLLIIGLAGGKIHSIISFKRSS